MKYKNYLAIVIIITIILNLVACEKELTILPTATPTKESPLETEKEPTFFYTATPTKESPLETEKEPTFFPTATPTKESPSETEKEPTFFYTATPTKESPLEIEKPTFDEFDVEWSLQSNLPHNLISNITKYSMILCSSDGKISGMHDDESLFGIDIETGKLIWSIDGGHMPIYYCVNKSEELVFVCTSTNYQIKLHCVNNITGEIEWEKELPEDTYYYGMISINESIVLNTEVKGSDKTNLLIIDEISGSLITERTLQENEYMLSYFMNLDYYFIVSPTELSAYDSSHTKIWQKTQLATNEIFDFYRCSYGYEIVNPKITAQDKIKLLDNNELNQIWFAVGKEFKLINITNGNEIDTIPSNGEAQLILLNSDYSIIKNDGFSLYSNEQKKVMWEKSDEIFGAYIYKNNLIYITKANIKCVSIENGEIIWESNYTLKDELYFNCLITPVSINGKLLIQSEHDILVYDIENGDYLFQLPDHSLAVQELYGLRIDYYKLYSYGEYLYVTKYIQESESGYIDKILLH